MQEDQNQDDVVSCKLTEITVSNVIVNQVNDKDSEKGTHTSNSINTLINAFASEEAIDLETFESNADSLKCAKNPDFGREVNQTFAVSVEQETKEDKNASANNENLNLLCSDNYNVSIVDKTANSFIVNDYKQCAKVCIPSENSNKSTVIMSELTRMEYTEEVEDNIDRKELGVEVTKVFKNQESEKNYDETLSFKPSTSPSSASSSHSNEFQSTDVHYLNPKWKDNDKNEANVNNTLIWPQSPEENIFLHTSLKENSNASYKQQSDADADNLSHGHPIQGNETSIGHMDEAAQSYHYNDVEMWGTETYATYAEDYKYKLTVESVPVFYASTYREFQNTKEENFLRGCKWSPDGSCIATNSNDNCLRVFKPFESQELGDTGNNDLSSKVRIKESGQIYDFAWHPAMTLYTPDFCRVACTCSGIPIHMWDSETGKIVANYRAYDQYDEVTAAYSLSFTLDGSKIYAGYNKAIRIFDTEYPVKSCKLVKTTNNKTKDGQSGIISCFAHSPDGSGLYVAGSYSRHIGIYDSACDKLVCLIQGQQGGVTHVMFSPDGTKLYSGGRKDAEILCWDTRNLGHILFSALRDVKTNQRIYFDLSQSGQYLASGNNDGTVAFWNTLSPCEEINGDMFLKPCSQFYAHSDCVNGVSFNNQHHMVATASGQRHFQDFGETDSEGEADQDRIMKEKRPRDFSLKLWKIPIEGGGE